MTPRGGPARPVGAIVGSVMERRPKEHVPKTCNGCGAPIIWAQVLDEHGEVSLREDGRPRSMPIDFQPDPRGNVVLFDRGGAVVARVLGKNTDPVPGVRLRMPHHATCPKASEYRRAPRGGGGRS